MTTRTTTVGQQRSGQPGRRTVLGMTAIAALLLATAAVGWSRSGRSAPTVPAPADVARPVSDTLIDSSTWSFWTPQHLTVYLVESLAQQQALQQRLEDGGARLGEVVVIAAPATTAADHIRQQAAVYGLEPEQVRVEDLRAGADAPAGTLLPPSCDAALLTHVC